MERLLELWAKDFDRLNHNLSLVAAMVSRLVIAILPFSRVYDKPSIDRDLKDRVHLNKIEMALTVRNTARYFGQ